MNEKELLTLLIGLGSPLLVVIGGLVSLFFKSRKEELQAIEERAVERRIETYNTILHPMISLFSDGSNEEALEIITSSDYKKAGFNLITFGSDEMVNNYNEMMQSFFKEEASTNPQETLTKFANFILSIRKDIYNKNTQLKDWDMLKFMITDIEKYID